jgi:hypothetical protein
MTNGHLAKSPDRSRTVERGGTTYTQNTAAIGKRPAAVASEQPAAPGRTKSLALSVRQHQAQAQTHFQTNSGRENMRGRAILLIFASVLAASAAHAGQCPADPFKASKAIWNWGDIPTGQVRTGKHPCGRQMTCTGGKFEPLVRRSCHWD